MAVRQLWVHEDEEGMRCLWPASALPHIAGDLGISAETAERSADPNGWGYSEIHQISHPEASFADHGLRRDAVMAALSPIMPRFDRIQTGDGKYYGFIDDDALCFGFDNMCFIYGATHDGMVRVFFFNAWTDDAGQLHALRRAVEAIDALSPASLVDYWVKEAGLTSDKVFLDSYFAALMDRAEARSTLDLIRNNHRHDPP